MIDIKYVFLLAIILVGCHPNDTETHRNTDILSQETIEREYPMASSKTIFTIKGPEYSDSDILQEALNEISYVALKFRDDLQAFEVRFDKETRIQDIKHALRDCCHNCWIHPVFNYRGKLNFVTGVITVSIKKDFTRFTPSEKRQFVERLKIGCIKRLEVDKHSVTTLSIEPQHGVSPYEVQSRVKQLPYLNYASVSLTRKLH